MITANYAFPVFTVNDLGTATDFYHRHFDFTPVFDNGWYVQLVSTTGIQLAFLLSEHHSQPAIFKPRYNGEGVIFSLDVADVDQAWEYARNNDLDIVLELKSENWGQRHFSIQDPNGILVDIYQPV